MILAIDFDGTIHDRAHPLEGKKMGAPLPGAVEALQDIHDAGHTIIIHSVMAATPGGEDAIEAWLDYYDIEYNGITAIKPQADHYIDDKAIHHTDWNTTLTKLGMEPIA